MIPTRNFHRMVCRMFCGVSSFSRPSVCLGCFVGYDGFVLGFGGIE